MLTAKSNHFCKSLLLLCLLLITCWRGGVARQSHSNDDQPDYADDETDLPYELIAEDENLDSFESDNDNNDLMTNELLPMRVKPARPRHYFPGRNFIYQLPNKSPKQSPKPSSKPIIKKVIQKKKKTTMIKNGKKVNIGVHRKVVTPNSATSSDHLDADDADDDQTNNQLDPGSSGAQLIPLQLYRQRVQSEFIGHGDGRPRLLSGELQCDCGLYVRSEKARVQRLSARLQRLWLERKKMKRQLNLVSALDRNLQLVCRSQSRARLSYQQSNGSQKPLYLAISNATAQSKPVNIHRFKDVL